MDQRFITFLLISLLLLPACTTTQNESTVATSSATSTPLSNSMTPTILPEATNDLPAPTDLAMTTEQFPSPNGRYVAMVSQSKPIVIDNSEQFYAAITIEEGERQWEVLSNWYGYGLGYIFPDVVQWSTNGRYLYYTHREASDGCSIFPKATGLYRFDTETATTADLLPSGFTRNLALSPDESQIAYTQFEGQSIMAVVRNIENSDERSVVVVDNLTSAQAGSLVWSPDGSYFLFTIAHEPCSPNWTHSIVRVDITEVGLTAVTLIEKDNRQFTTLNWLDSQQTAVQLQDKEGRQWQMDTTSGETIPGDKIAPTLDYTDTAAGCGDIFVYKSTVDQSEYITVWVAANAFDLSNSPATLDIAAHPESIVAQIDMYSGKITDRGEFPYCNDVAPMAEPQSVWTATSGTVIVTVPADAPTEPCTSDPYQATISLENVIFSLNEQTVTVPSLSFDDVPVGWCSG